MKITWEMGIRELGTKTNLWEVATRKDAILIRLPRSPGVEHAALAFLRDTYIATICRQQLNAAGPDHAINAKLPPKRRGRRPTETNRVKQEMLTDIGSGKRTLLDIWNMKEEEELAPTYGTSRYTAVRAMTEIVADSNSRQFPTTDNFQHKEI